MLGRLARHSDVANGDLAAAKQACHAYQNIFEDSRGEARGGEAVIASTCA
jgi:hypothetical protein